MIEMINNSFYETKNNFLLIKKESSNVKKTYGRWKRWVLVGKILQKYTLSKYLGSNSILHGG